LFDGETTLHFSGAKSPYLLLPVIPPKKAAARRTPKRR
jgi:hypothetical protein